MAKKYKKIGTVRICKVNIPSELKEEMELTGDMTKAVWDLNYQFFCGHKRFARNKLIHECYYDMLRDLEAKWENGYETITIPFSVNHFTYELAMRVTRRIKYCSMETIQTMIFLAYKRYRESTAFGGLSFSEFVESHERDEDFEFLAARE